jgi:hypothetical protein
MRDQRTSRTAATNEPPVMSFRPCPRSIQAPTGIEQRPATIRPDDSAPNMPLRDQPSSCVIGTTNSGKV